MKKWMWVVLLVLVAVGIVSSSKFLQNSSRVENSTDVAPILTTASSQSISIPKVSQERLLAHVKQLNFQRYTEAERDSARSYITQSLKKSGWLPKLESFEGGVNIFAQRQGTEPQAGSILIAAHYDTVSNSPGADDNASGVAVVLEVARLLGSRSTPRGLQLAFFDQEERGLGGSKAFATNKEHLQNLQGVVVLDMVGYACYTAGCQKYPTGLPFTPPTNRGDFLAVVGDMEHLPLLNFFQQSEANLPPIITLPVPLKGMLMPDVLRSDHAPFWYQGIGAVLVTDTANLRTPHYHQPSDTLANIDNTFLKKSAQIVVNAITQLLDSSDRLQTQPPSTD